PIQRLHDRAGPFKGCHSVAVSVSVPIPISSHTLLLTPPTRASHPDRCRCSHLLPCHGTRHKVSSQDWSLLNSLPGFDLALFKFHPPGLSYTLHTTTHPPPSPNCIVIGINSRSTADRPSSADSSGADHRLNLSFCTVSMTVSLRVAPLVICFDSLQSASFSVSAVPSLALRQPLVLALIFSPEHAWQGREVVDRTNSPPPDNTEPRFPIRAQPITGSSSRPQNALLARWSQLRI
ncbi:hypothetical protein CTA2_9399, partial [Colletotrichum tanaceti]